MKKCLVLLCLLVVAGCGKVQMAPDAETAFRAMARRVAEMADKCDPNSPYADDPACLTGWRTFSEDLSLFVTMMEGGEPNGQ